MASNIYDVLRKEGLLLDFKIVGIAGKEFPAHKAVLAAHSEYFRAIFRTDMIENRTNEICYVELLVDILENILDYCYKGQLELTTRDVFDYLEAASFLQMKDLENTCTSFLEKNIHTCCLRIINRCGKIQQLEQKALEYCSENIVALSESEDFLSLDYDTFKRILSGATCDHTDRFDALKSWIEADVTNRKPLIDDLASLIMFTDLDAQFLVKASNWSLIRDSRSVCSNLIDQAKDSLLMKPKTSEVPM